MKKLHKTLILALAGTLALSACGNDDSNNTGSGDSGYNVPDPSKLVGEQVTKDVWRSAWEFRGNNYTVYQKKYSEANNMHIDSGEVYAKYDGNKVYGKVPDYSQATLDDPMSFADPPIIEVYLSTEGSTTYRYDHVDKQWQKHELTATQDVGVSPMVISYVTHMLSMPAESYEYFTYDASQKAYVYNAGNIAHTVKLVDGKIRYYSEVTTYAPGQISVTESSIYDYGTTVVRLPDEREEDPDPGSSGGNGSGDEPVQEEFTPDTTLTNEQWAAALMPDSLVNCTLYRRMTSNGSVETAHAMIDRENEKYYFEFKRDGRVTYSVYYQLDDEIYFAYILSEDGDKWVKNRSDRNALEANIDDCYGIFSLFVEGKDRFTVNNGRYVAKNYGMGNMSLDSVELTFSGGKLVIGDLTMGEDFYHVDVTKRGATVVTLPENFEDGNEQEGPGDYYFDPEKCTATDWAAIFAYDRFYNSEIHITYYRFDPIYNEVVPQESRYLFDIENSRISGANIDMSYMPWYIVNEENGLFRYDPTEEGDGYEKYAIDGAFIDYYTSCVGDFTVFAKRFDEFRYVDGYFMATINSDYADTVCARIDESGMLRELRYFKDKEVVETVRIVQYGDVRIYLPGEDHEWTPSTGNTVTEEQWTAALSSDAFLNCAISINKGSYNIDAATEIYLINYDLYKLAVIADNVTKLYYEQDGVLHLVTQYSHSDNDAPADEVIAGKTYRELFLEYVADITQFVEMYDYFEYDEESGFYALAKNNSDRFAVASIVFDQNGRMSSIQYVIGDTGVRANISAMAYGDIELPFFSSDGE